VTPTVDLDPSSREWTFDDQSVLTLSLFHDALRLASKEAATNILFEKRGPTKALLLASKGEYVL
jgi:hypothetical protein